MPAGVLIPGCAATLAPVFGALVGLQPVAWTAAGLVCAPRAAPDDRPASLATCPVPWTVHAAPAVWPDPPARWVAGWYLRSPVHAPAPPGVRELIQVPGDGFGSGAHPTTVMCLHALWRMPPGPAVDLGCGSGLLSLAWCVLGRGPVLAVDLDGAAIRQADATLRAAGHRDMVDLRAAPVQAAAPRLGGSVVLANMPAAAHNTMHACMHACMQPRGMVVSGVRAGRGRAVADAYARRTGLRIIGAMRRDGWECWSLGR